METGKQIGKSLYKGQKGFQKELYRKNTRKCMTDTRRVHLCAPRSLCPSMDKFSRPYISKCYFFTTASQATLWLICCGIGVRLPHWPYLAAKREVWYSILCGFPSNMCPSRSQERDMYSSEGNWVLT